MQFSQATVTAPNALAVNPQALDGLRSLAAKGDDKAALKASAQQFEAFFLQMMMKSMRATIQDDGPFDTQETRAFTEMFDQQVAMSVSRSKGVGFADMLVKQLELASHPNSIVAAPRPYDLPPTVSAPASANKTQQTNAYGHAAYQAMSLPTTAVESKQIDLHG